LYRGEARPDQLESLGETLAQKYAEKLKTKQYSTQFHTTPNAHVDLFNEVGDDYARVIEQYRNPQLK
jgi:hypothetical protein